MKQRKIPLRKCTGCQEMKNKKELIRIVRSDEGEFSVDATGKRPVEERIFAPAPNVWKRQESQRDSSVRLNRPYLPKSMKN